jgi:hypothetical protein
MAALESARHLEEAGLVEYEGAMVVNRLNDGTVSSPATSEHSAGWGVLSAGPGESARDGIHPFRHRRVKHISNSIENTLPPGSSGVVLLTKKGWMDASDHVLVNSARVTKSPVDGRLVEQLRERDAR